MSKVPPPSPQEQVRFLRNVQRLLGEGNFVASYKFALLRSLADLALIHGDDTGSELTLDSNQIAESFIQLYWRQAAPYPVTEGNVLVLRQNTGSPAAVVTAIAHARETLGSSLVAARAKDRDWRRLVSTVRSTVEKQPLWRLQTVGRERLDFLYPSVGSGRTITLRRGVAYCLRAYHGLIGDLVQGAWLRYVRNLNAQALGHSSDLSAFMFGSERGALGSARAILEDVQKRRCIYCERAIRSVGEVDHFVPWSRYPTDLGANLVLAHAKCNNQKSDHLAGERHLEHWTVQLSDHAGELEERFTEAGMPFEFQASQRVAAWAYGQVAGARGQVWIAGKELERLGEAWRELLPTG